jgi:hypothetical protein
LWQLAATDEEKCEESSQSWVACDEFLSVASGRCGYFQQDVSPREEGCGPEVVNPHPPWAPRLGRLMDYSGYEVGEKRFRTPQITQYPIATPKENAATMVNRSMVESRNVVMMVLFFRCAGSPRMMFLNTPRLRHRRVRGRTESRTRRTNIYCDNATLPRVDGCCCWQLRYVSRIAFSLSRTFQSSA